MQEWKYSQYEEPSIKPACGFYILICFEIWLCLRRTLTLHLFIDNFYAFHFAANLNWLLLHQEEKVCLKFTHSFAKASQVKFFCRFLKGNCRRNWEFENLLRSCRFPLKIYPVFQSSSKEKLYGKRGTLVEAMARLYCFCIKLYWDSRRGVFDAKNMAYKMVPKGRLL